MKIVSYFKFSANKNWQQKDQNMTNSILKNDTITLRLSYCELQLNYIAFKRVNEIRVLKC